MKISVHIKPNSRHREEVVKNDDDTLTVYIKAPAIEGRANAAAIKLLIKFTDKRRPVSYRRLNFALLRMNSPAV